MTELKLTADSAQVCAMIESHRATFEELLLKHTPEFIFDGLHNSFFCFSHDFSVDTDGTAPLTCNFIAGFDIGRLIELLAPTLTTGES